MLCADDKEDDHRYAFENFSRTHLHRNVIWINTAPDMQPSDKYLLLCKLKTRAPEDVECDLDKLRIKSKIKLKIKTVHA